MRAGDAGILVPTPVLDIKKDRVAMVTAAGRLLIVRVKELPQMSKGRGVKIINIDAKKYSSGEDRAVAVGVLHAGDCLRISSGKQHSDLKARRLRTLFRRARPQPDNCCRAAFVKCIRCRLCVKSFNFLLRLSLNLSLNKLLNPSLNKGASK